MPRGTSAKRHAQAVFQIALQAGELEGWQKDLDTLASIMEDAQFKAVLESSRVRQGDKLELLRKQLTHISPLALNLACFLVVKGRVGIARGIAEEYRHMLNRHRGLVMVEVTTALPLDDRGTRHISQRLSEATGKEISLSSTVGPEIIGGLVIKIGDQLIDGSTRSRLREMRKALMEQGA